MSVETPALADALAQLDGNADGVAMYFTSHLLATHPDLIERWPVGLAEQRRLGYFALREVVEAAENGQDVGQRLAGWARGLSRMSLGPDDLTSMAVSVEATLRRFLGDAFLTAHGDRLAAVHRAIMPTLTRQMRGFEAQPAGIEAEVVGHTLVRPDLAVVTLRPAAPPVYAAGQSIPIGDPRRPKVWRPYTPAQPPREDGLLEFHVRAVAGGYVSPSLVFETAPGDVLTLTTPVGTLGWASPTTPAVMLAAGTGVTPFSAMLQGRAADRADGPVGSARLILCAPGERDLYAPADLRDLAASADWLTLDTVTGADSPEEIVGGGRWSGHDLYVCGSPRFVSSVVAALVTGGHDRGEIHVEEFGSARSAPARATAHGGAA